MGEELIASNPRVNRRTLVKGAAWAAPVVTLGAAAPLSAASPSAVTPSVHGSCRKGKYHITFAFKNGLSCSTTIAIQSLRVIAPGGQMVGLPGLVTVFTLGVGQSLSRTYKVDGTHNLSGATLQVTYSYTDCSGTKIAETTNLNPQLSPCGQEDDESDDEDDDKSRSPAPTNSQTPAAPKTPAPSQSSTSGPTKPTPPPTTGD